MEISRKHLDQYLHYCEYNKNLNIKTIKAYRTDLLQYLTFTNTTKTEREMKEDVSSYLAELHSQVKPKTVKRKVASLKAFFSYCEIEGIIDVSPFSKLKIKYNEPFILPKTIPAESMVKILNVAHSSLQNNKLTDYEHKTIVRDIAVLEMLFATGMRVSELCSLSICSLNLGEKMIRIFGKGARERMLYLTNDSVTAVLQKYLSYRNEYNPSSDAPLFINRDRRRLDEQSVRRIINKYVALAGINMHITPHMFRHTFATLLLEEDVDIRYIQRFLGHSSILTTQIYTHVSATKQRQILTEKHPRNRWVI